MASKTESYTVAEDGFINGLFRTKGDVISLTEAQAAFYDVAKVTAAEAPKTETRKG